MSDPAGWAARRLHFIAIGGAGMSGAALVCAQLGAEVSGSDRSESSYIERLRAAGIEPSIGHDPAQLPADAEVIISTAIGEDNPELARARERGQPVRHRGELLAELCRSRRLIAVSGTHGKTTTAAMLVWALREIGEDPCFFLGGELPGAGPGGEAANAAWAEGEWVVAEADESDASFLELEPEVAVITNLELDHHARWGSLRALSEAFAAFASPARGVAIGAEVELPGLDAELLRFALQAPDPAAPAPAADLLATAIEADGGGGSSFHLAGAAIELDAALAVPGRHNVANATAAIAAATLAGVDPGAAAQALASFGGVVRRMELKGLRGGARIYDDYAHHPTEVRAALEAARELTGGRLFAVFQPHLYSRTKALADDFGAALTGADEIAVMEVYPAREQPLGPLAGVSGRRVAEAAAQRAGGRPVWWLPDRELVARALGERLADGDVLVTIGAGDVFRLAEALVEGAGVEGEGDGQGAGEVEDSDEGPAG